MDFIFHSDRDELHYHLSGTGDYQLSGNCQFPFRRDCETHSGKCGQSYFLHWIHRSLLGISLLPIQKENLSKSLITEEPVKPTIVNAINFVSLHLDF